MSFHIDRPADATYIAYGEDRFTDVKDKWTDLPGAKIPLKLGKGEAAYGAIFVATFSAEAICSLPNHNGVLSATVFFGDVKSEPDSENHRYVTAGGGGEWNSHSFMRVLHFDHELEVRDVTAQVRLTTGANVTEAGVQNWVLKVERYNL
jgi:hypothetical protein